MDLNAFAAAIKGVAARCEADLAITCAREAATDYITVLRAVTPKRSGALADSETVDSVSGSGVVATATAGPHIVYAEFRDRGGTIRVKNARVLTDGVSFFGKQVTQAGSHYMAAAEAGARPAIEAACQKTLDGYIHL